MSDEYLDYLQDILSPLGDISKGRLFGLRTLKYNNLQFAMFNGETLYFAVNAKTRDTYLEADSPPFSYVTKYGRTEVHKYYEVPGEVLDDEDTMQEWARVSIDAARTPDKKSADAAAKARKRLGLD